MDNPAFDFDYESKERNESSANPTEGEVAEKNSNSIWKLIDKTVEGKCLQIEFKTQLTPNKFLIWDTIYVNDILYMQVPNDFMGKTSTLDFAHMLIYADKVLECKHAIVYFPKDSKNREYCMETFKVLGFTESPFLDNPWIGASDTNCIYMIYKIKQEVEGEQSGAKTVESG